MDFSNKTLLLGVGGGVAAYKACDFIRELQRHGASQVWPLLTETAAQFVSPLTLSALAKVPAHQDPLAVDGAGVPLHISLAQQADALVILPATANLLARLWAGMADDLVTTTALTMTGKPLILVPAMNTRMWKHPLTRRNLSELAALPNVTVVEPKAGLLACGETGMGHLAEPALILQALYRAVHPRAGQLMGRRALVTAGGTREPLDPVRELSNRSSGKMGLALADELHAMGADVQLITAQSEPLLRPYSVVAVKTVSQMRDAVLALASSCDLVYKAAAVSDFRPCDVHATKIKKPIEAAHHRLELEKTPDILAELGRVKPSGQVLVGFAAETDHWLTYACDKLERKQLDWLVLNDVSRDDIGFAADANEVTVLGAGGSLQLIEKAPKWQIARTIIEITAVSKRSADFDDLAPSLAKEETVLRASS